MDAEAKRRQLSAALNRVAGGDRHALCLVYEMTSAKLFGVCLRILNDRSEAEDVLQDVYLTVWRKAASFDDARASPITWLVAIARNRSIDRLRSAGVVRFSQPIEAADAVADPAPSAAQTLEDAQESKRLKSCLDEIEARQSAAIRSAFMDGLTYEVLAEREACRRIEAALGSAATMEEPHGMWQSLAFWRGLATATSALAVACLAALIYVGAISQPGAPLLARLDAEGGKPSFVAAINTNGGNLTIVPAALLGAEQKSMELWLIPPGDKPHSLGLIDPNRPVTIKVPKDLLREVSNEAVLAVSLEPLGGSPTGQPTGPVIANGKLASL